MKKILSTLLITGIVSFSSHAGWLVGNTEGVHDASANIKRFTSNYRNTGNFAVEVEGGSGVCSKAKWIVFDKNNMPTEAWLHSFEIAKSAFIEGHKVNIYNYDSSSCLNAQFIEVVRH